MKFINRLSVVTAASLIAFLSCSPSARAEVVVTDFLISDSSVSFTVSTTLPLSLPTSFRHLLFIVHKDATTDWVDTTSANTMDAGTLSGTVTGPLDWVRTQDTPGSGDVIVMKGGIGSDNGLTTGETITGSFSHDFGSGTFATENINVDDFRLYWGYNGFSGFTTGRLLGEVSGNVVTEPVDSDGDGVPDNEDACPDSILDDTVIIGDIDTGVDNILFDNGCTTADLIAEADAMAENDGQLLKAINALFNGLKKEGLITGAEKGEIISALAQSQGAP